MKDIKERQKDIIAFVLFISFIIFGFVLLCINAENHDKIINEKYIQQNN